MILRKTHTIMTRSLNKYVQRILDWNRGQKYPPRRASSSQRGKSPSIAGLLVAWAGSGNADCLERAQKSLPRRKKNALNWMGMVATLNFLKVLTVSAMISCKPFL